MIRQANEGDTESIAEIYNHYVLNTVITFEEETVSASDIEDRVCDVKSAGLPWLVAEEEGSVLGYAYASEWKGRCAYRFSVEATVYLSPDVASRGWGTKLYTALLDELKRCSIHVVLGGIALPNPASIALHEKLGFEKVAHFTEVGFKFNEWVDVGYWQVKL